MSEYVITTDSNSDIPKDYMNNWGTVVIPQYYMFGHTLYGDEINMTPTEFYDRMKDGGLPKSKPNDPKVIEAKFRSILKQGKDIVHIAFSSALSDSYDNVCKVAEKLVGEFPNSGIAVIDSLNVSLAETIMVVYANNLKAQNCPYEELVNRLEEFKEHINAIFTVKDLFHLQRGGRVSKATAIVGSALNLKPTLSIAENGTIASDGTVMGRKKALNSLIERMKVTLDPRTDYSLPVGVVHANCIEDAQYVADLIRQQTRYRNVIINDISPSIGSHTGPGAVGVFYYGQVKKPRTIK